MDALTAAETVDSPVDVDMGLLVTNNGTAFTYLRATMTRERDNGTVTVREEIVKQDDDIVLHRRMVEQNGETITHVTRPTAVM